MQSLLFLFWSTDSESGNKSSRILAKGETEANTRPSLFSDKIYQNMKQFYVNLYSSDCDPTDWKRKDFLDR